MSERGRSEKVRALVTGGSGAIGAAICRRLCAAGHHVVVHGSRRLDAAQQLADELREGGGEASAVGFDVTDAAATRAVLDELLSSGPIQILVNNAGVHDDQVFAGMGAERWQRVLDVNLNGFFNVTQPLTLPMLHTRWGRIVNVSSVAAQRGNRGQVNYAAAKGALEAATRSLALELATRGVTVNAVAPGIIASEMSEGAFDAARIAADVPMRRAGTPDEVAALVAWLCRREAGYITGQVIGVNGGIG
ncbi:MAG: 3-oxoacyl-ACP reductase FabG [Steroidobacteraceae bacterium]